MSAQSNAALARQIYDQFSKGDFESVLSNAAEDMEVELVPFGQTFSGHQGFRDFMGVFKQAFPDIVVTIDNQVATDTHVVNECTWNGIHKGILMTPTGEIPATGGKVEGARFCEVWEIRNGKLVSIHNYQDPATWLRQLGLA